MKSETVILDAVSCLSFGHNFKHKLKSVTMVQVRAEVAERLSNKLYARFKSIGSKAWRKTG